MKPTLSAATNIALIAASLAVVTNSSLDIYSRLHPGSPAAATAAPRLARAAFNPGAKAPVVPGVDYASSDKTLVLFLSTHCHFCEESLPFYRDLNTRLGNNTARHLVAVFPQTAAEVRKFKDQRKFEIDTVADMQLGEYGVSGTPTLLLVAKDGTVIKSWVGAAADPVKQAIASAFLPG